MDTDINKYKAKSGTFIAVYTLEIQTLSKYVDKILDAIIKVHPLSYGKYQRNASISALGMETSQPEAGSTTVSHIKTFIPGQTETYPVLELKISIERDLKVLEKVMDAIHYVHHYEEPVIFLREDWVSRAAYNPNNLNPNRWWNNGLGMPERVDI